MIFLVPLGGICIFPSLGGFPWTQNLVHRGNWGRVGKSGASSPCQSGVVSSSTSRWLKVKGGEVVVAGEHPWSLTWKSHLEIMPVWKPSFSMLNFGGAFFGFDAGDFFWWLFQWGSTGFLWRLALASKNGKWRWSKCSKQLSYIRSSKIHMFFSEGKIMGKWVFLFVTEYFC